MATRRGLFTCRGMCQAVRETKPVPHQAHHVQTESRDQIPAGNQHEHHFGVLDDRTDQQRGGNIPKRGAGARPRVKSLKLG